jgi:tetratricopeptide (TPR) repeat protein
MKHRILYFLFAGLVACSSPSTEDDTQNTAQNNAPSSPPDREIRTPLDSISKYISDNPEDAEAYALRANLYLDKRNLQFGLADANEALRLDSNNANAYLAMGKLFYTQNKSRDARTAWTTCVKLDQENVECRMRLAELYIAVRNFEEALKLLNEVTKIENTNATAFLMKGVIARDFRQDTALALNYFQKAIDLDQDYLDALDLMAVTLSNVGDTTAQFYFDRILAQSPNRADVYYKMGVLYMNAGEPNKALSAYTKAVQLNPSDAQSYYNLGFMHLEIKEYAKARDYFDKAIKSKDRNYQAYYARGYSFEMLGNTDQAKADYRKSLEILNIYKPAAEGLARLNAMDAEIAADRKRKQ